MQNETQNIPILRIIREHKLNRTHLANKINMNSSTFKLKLNSNFPQYRFTDLQIEELGVALIEMCDEIQKEIISSNLKSI